MGAILLGAIGKHPRMLAFRMARTAGECRHCWKCSERLLPRAGRALPAASDEIRQTLNNTNCIIGCTKSFARFCGQRLRADRVFF
jgi:hypothetical protein